MTGAGTPPRPRVWFVTGTSSGLGRAYAEAALARGDRVAATARRPADIAELGDRYGDGVMPLTVDVRERGQVDEAMAAAVRRFGCVDVVVNNAGYGLLGAVEEVPDDEARAVVDTNFFGMVHVTRAALPYLRSQRAGHIVQVSSIAGRLGRAGFAFYAASKAATVGFSEALADEVRPFGIAVTILEVGSFRTDANTRSMRHVQPMAEYRETLGPRRAMFEGLAGSEPGDPRRAASLLLRVVDMPAPPLHLAVGSDAHRLIRAHLADQVAALDAQEELSRSPDFPVTAGGD